MKNKDYTALRKIREVANDNFVDITAGKEDIDFWKKEVDRTYHRTVVPRVMVLVLERDRGKYNGAMYVSKEDFR